MNRPPYFVDLYKDNQNDEKVSQFNDQDFRITDLTISESVNGSSRAFLSMQFVSNQKKYFTDTIKTIEDFLKSQLFKHVTLCAEYRDSVDPKKDQNSQKTYFHGILSNYSVAFGVPYDTITLELSSYFDLLKLQNNYRTFENKNIRDILVSVFEYYADGKGGGLVGSRFQYDFSEIIPDIHTSTRVQVMQIGESDYDFVVRLLKEDGLSFFNYHTPQTSIFVLMPDIVETLTNYEKKQKPEFSFPIPLSYIVAPITTAPAPYPTSPMDMRQRSGLEDLWTLNNLRIKSSTTNGEAQTLNYKVGDDYRFSQKSDGGELNKEIKKKKDDDKATSSIQPPFKFEWTKYASSQANNPDVDAKKIADYFDVQMKNDLARQAFFKHTSSADGKTLVFLSLMRKVSLLIDTARDSYARPPFLSASRDVLERVIYGLTMRYRTSVVSKPSPTAQTMPSVFHYFETSLKFFDPTTNDRLLIPFESSIEDTFAARSAEKFTAVVVPFTDQDKKIMKTKKSKAQSLVPNMIRIRFPWQKLTESTLARMSFSWTGHNYGSMFLPEVGSEVIVTFTHNNYDYPIIIGCLYNTDNIYPEIPNFEQLELKSGLGVRGIQFAPTEEGECLMVMPFHPDDPKTDMRTVFLRSNQLLKVRALGNKSTDVAANAELSVLKKEGTYTVSVGDTQSDSSLAMTVDKIEMHSSSKNVLSVAKNGKIEIKSDDSIAINSGSIQLKGKEKITLNGSTSSVAIEAGQIEANSLKIQK